MDSVFPFPPCTHSDTPPPRCGLNLHDLLQRYCYCCYFHETTPTTMPTKLPACLQCRLESPSRRSRTTHRPRRCTFHGSRRRRTRFSANSSAIASHIGRAIKPTMTCARCTSGRATSRYVTISMSANSARVTLQRETAVGDSECVAFPGSLVV